MSKHTPGPWQAVRNQVRAGRYRICSNVNAGESLPLYESIERAHENARLIAAAPDLLEALQRLIESSRDCGEMQWYSETALASPWDMARAVIERATGAQP